MSVWRLMVAAVFVVAAFGVSLADDAAQRAKDATIVRTLVRLPGLDLSTRPDAKAALLRHLETIRGTEAWLELVEKFKLRELNEELLAAATSQEEGATSARAARLLLALDEQALLRQAIGDPDREKAVRAIRAIGRAADARANDLLTPLVLDAEVAVAVRSAAVTAIARNAPGQKALLAIVERGELAMDLEFAAADALLSSPDDTIRTAAAKHLSLPAGASGEPLPPIAELVKRNGDAVRGKTLFAGVGTCAKCHTVRGEGKEVGPDLSEIGSKLSKEALYVSILDPSAGVSFNYETWLARTLDGTVLSGILVSQTDETIELKTTEAIVHRLPRADLDALKKQPTSLMPADLQKQLQAQDLVDIVAYLMTLKKPNGSE